MFGWLRRQQRQEYAKLLYQNDVALAYLQGYFRNDQNMLTWITGALKRNRELGMATSASQSSLDLNQLEWLLRTNKEVRRIYDTTLGSTVGSFDNIHAPPEGWSAYFKNAQEGG